jgi:Fe-S cluster assembly protein SufD
METFMTSKTMTKNKISVAAVRRLSKRYNEPEWLRFARLIAWETFEALPWPSYREETWRRTRLTGFELEDYRLSGEEAALIPSRDALPEHLRLELEKIDSAGVIIVQDGVLIYQELDDALAQKGVRFTDLRSALAEDAQLVQVHLSALVRARQNKFAALHYALWQNGAFLFVPRNVVIEKPLQALIVQGEGLASFHHSLLIGEENSEAVVVEDFVGSRNGMSDSVAEVYAKQAARLHYLRLQNLDETAWNFATQRASVGRDALYRQLQASWGSKLSKVWIDMEMDEPGGHGELLGLYFPRDRQHLDHHTNQNHQEPNCTSDLLFKGALEDRARSIYQGMIRVHHGAQRTDAYQKNDNLLLSGRARADSIPGLEIEADDVRCTHGATSSKVPEEYIFYLMARGLSRQTAKRMIVQGFFEEVINRVPVPGVRDKLEAEIAHRVGIE